MGVCGPPGASRCFARASLRTPSRPHPPRRAIRPRDERDTDTVNAETSVGHHHFGIGSCKSIRNLECAHLAKPHQAGVGAGRPAMECQGRNVVNRRDNGGLGPPPGRQAARCAAAPLRSAPAGDAPPPQQETGNGSLSRTTALTRMRQRPSQSCWFSRAPRTGGSASGRHRCG